MALSVIQVGKGKYNNPLLSINVSRESQQSPANLRICAAMTHPRNFNEVMDLRIQEILPTVIYFSLKVETILCGNIDLHVENLRGIVECAESYMVRMKDCMERNVVLPHIVN